MQCVNCGRPLQPHAVHCPLCGHPVAREATPPAQAGPQDDVTVVSYPPVDPFAPTVYGPPVSAPPGQAASPPGDAGAAGPAYPPKWVGGYVPLTPRPAPPRRRRGCLPLVAGASALVLAALLVTGAFLASGVRLAGLHFPSASADATHTSAATATAAARPTATPVSPCPVPSVSPGASQALSAAQLSTGIVSSDPNHVDLRPVGVTSNFTVGQVIYVTYQFATNQAGTVRGEFCANDMSGANVATATQSVPSGYRDGRGEFHLLTPLTRANVGRGVVTLTWNGAVTVVLPFTVKAA